MTMENPFGPEMQKYWDRRYDLFSRWDHGISFDKEALFSIKPEAAACQIVARIDAAQIIDPMCGVGGIVIAAARLGKATYASDLNPQAVKSAKGNADLYGVAEEISWDQGDALELALTKGTGLRGTQALYLDPPWGGPDYYKKERFQLADFAPDVTSLIESYLHQCGDVVLSAPNNFDLQEVKNITRNFVAFPSYTWGKEICLNIIMRR